MTRSEGETIRRIRDAVRHGFPIRTGIDPLEARQSRRQQWVAPYARG